MADIISPEGIQLSTYDELLSDIQAEMNAIYASDGDLINFGSETPDGQFTNVLAQIGTDIRETIQEVYNSFDPDKCTGVIQDSRYALNFITRKGGSFTIQNIDVTVDRTVTLEGLDANYNDTNAASYTVSDNAGNLWYLIDTTTKTAGTHSLPFRSQHLGMYQTTTGTINNQVTKVIGVTSVNNSVAPTVLGESQESDVEFRIRRNRSTSTAGLNNYDAMIGQLLELDGVTDTIVHVNNTASTDSTGTAAYTVWAIVEGGANDAIANIIYQNGCGLSTRGAVSVNTKNIAGQIVTINFDRDNPVRLYISFDVKITDPTLVLNTANLAELVAENLSFNLNAPAETSYITDVAANQLAIFGTGAFVLNVQVSTDNINFADFIAPASLKDKFTVAAADITITTV